MMSRAAAALKRTTQGEKCESCGFEGHGVSPGDSVWLDSAGWAAGCGVPGGRRWREGTLEWEPPGARRHLRVLVKMSGAFHHYLIVGQQDVIGLFRERAARKFAKVVRSEGIQASRVLAPVILTVHLQRYPMFLRLDLHRARSV